MKRRPNNMILEAENAGNLKFELHGRKKEKKIKEMQ